MRNLIIEDIINECDGELVIGDLKSECIDFCIDTRKLKKDDIYFGLKGEKINGGIFYEKALELGAKACIIQDIDVSEEVKQKYSDRSIIKVKDTLVALQKLAKFKRSLYNIPVIAITGSVGKTSTKDIISSVVAKKFNVLKTEGNFNNHIGLPLTILRLKNHNALVVEMGMSNLGEISLLTNIAKPTIAVITNVGTAHIGNLGSRANILKAKLEILEGLSDNGPIIINNDNDMLHMWNEQNSKYKAITFGIENKSNIMAKNVCINSSGSKYEIEHEGKKYTINVHVSGYPFVYNSMSAICVGNELKIDMHDIIDGIENFELTKNRMEIEKINNITIINDCYNANYDSMKAGIENLARLQGKRKIAILGDMLELGEFSKDLHCKVGEEVAKNKIDILITVGNESKNIAETAKKHGMNEENIFIFENNNQVINLINKIKKGDDCILIKASNGMHFIELVNNLKTGE